LPQAGIERTFGPYLLGTTSKAVERVICRVSRFARITAEVGTSNSMEQATAFSQAL
jgi:hypothetical protein